jgi:hypothetical protein
MKPNDKQKKIIDLIKGQVSFWLSTNDISSPTHYCDIDQDCVGLTLENDLTEEQAEELAVKISDLFTFVKNLK